MSYIPNTITDQTATAFINGVPHSVDASNPNFDEIVSELGRDNADADKVLRLMSPIETVKATIAAMDDADVVFDGQRVTFRGVRLPEALEQRLLRASVAFEPVALLGLKRLAANIMLNPDVRARDEINLFLQAGDFVVTEDGCVLAYKAVRDDYTDIRTGTFDNSVGQEVTMPRDEVDPERERTCSRGLHFCAKSYLPHFARTAGGRVVVVKVNPRDIVSIPSDYNNAKGRTWRYVVVGEVELTDANRNEWAQIAATPAGVADGYDYDDEWEDDDFDYDDEWDAWDDEVEADEVVSTTAFVAPTTGKPSIWQGIKAAVQRRLS